MHDGKQDITEIHLPERWAVLEQALRQMSAEAGDKYPGDSCVDAVFDELEPMRS